MAIGTESSLKYDVFALAEILKPEYEAVGLQVRDRLDSFECSRSPHIQEFARGAVHRWEKHGHSRTYVLVAESDDRVEVPGLFTVGITMLDLTQASKSNRERLMGDISMEQTGAFSIAELARSDGFSAADLPGSVILDEAKEVIKRARQYIGGRFLVVDSREEIFDRLYQPAGFRKISIAESPRGMEDTNFVTSCCVIKDWNTDTSS